MNDTQVDESSKEVGSIKDFLKPTYNNTSSKSKNDIDIPWRHGAYKVFYNVKRFFCSPSKPVRPKPKSELDLLAQVGILLQTEQSSNEETINKCSQLLTLHRHMEDTSARKRLERWAKYVISFYLFVVLLILLFSGGLFSGWGIKLNLEREVIIVLLSTTTINVIGLGLIVLRGHFPNGTKTISNNTNKKEDSTL